MKPKLQAEARVLSVQAERRSAEIALQELLALAKRVNQQPSRLFALPSGARSNPSMQLIKTSQLRQAPSWC